VTGTAGADTFAIHLSTVVATPQAIAHVVGYSAGQGDTFDFSAPMQSAAPAALTAALAAGDFRVAEDAGGTFATLQLHYGAGDNDWLSIAQLDGVHASDPVNVAIDAAHVAHLHAAVLA
jgi:Ca2+-binding RTX toxin-like protein